jgi:hypothetical protein
MGNLLGMQQALTTHKISMMYKLQRLWLAETPQTSLKRKHLWQSDQPLACH